MTTLSFSVPGRPVAKQRARAYMRGQHIGHYTPPETVNYESIVAMCASEAMNKSGVERFSGPTRVHVEFWFDIPPSRKKLKEGDWHCQRPDLDNCKKSILDGGNHLIWADDCIICEISAVKRWTTGQARAEVTIEGICQEPS